MSLTARPRVPLDLFRPSIDAVSQGNSDPLAPVGRERACRPSDVGRNAIAILRGGEATTHLQNLAEGRTEGTRGFQNRLVVTMVGGHCQVGILVPLGELPRTLWWGIGKGLG